MLLSQPQLANRSLYHWHFGNRKSKAKDLLPKVEKRYRTEQLTNLHPGSSVCKPGNVVSKPYHIRCGSNGHCHCPKEPGSTRRNCCSNRIQAGKNWTIELKLKTTPIIGNIAALKTCLCLVFTDRIVYGIYVVAILSIILSIIRVVNGTLLLLAAQRVKYT
jgi:hypothetical protein